MPDYRAQARIALRGTVNTKQAKPEPARDPFDRGADGDANKARPRTTEQVATGDTRRGREATDAVRYQDTHPWDHYERGALLTDRQIDAGWALTKLYSQGFTPMIALAKYGAIGATLSDEEEALKSKARRDYDKLANLVPHDCRHAMACMVRGEFPQMAMRIEYLRRACDLIADELKIPRTGVGV